MGIQGLLPALAPITFDYHVSSLRGKRVAVDAYVWLHRGTYSQAQTLALRPNDPHAIAAVVRYFMTLVGMLKHHGESARHPSLFKLRSLAPRRHFSSPHCSNLTNAAGVEPLLVFDGSPLPAKRPTEVKRRAARTAARAEGRRLLTAGDTAGARDALSKAVDVGHALAAAVQNRLISEGVAFVVAPCGRADTSGRCCGADSLLWRSFCVDVAI